MKRVAVFPGSFDPLTLGHKDIVERGLKMFDAVIVAVANNPKKKGLFSENERVHILRSVFKNMPRVHIDSFDGLLVNYMKKVRASVILKGLRTGEDFEYERQLAQANKGLAASIDTVFMMTDPKFLYFSSSLIKEIVMFGGSIKAMVPGPVEKMLKAKFRSRGTQYTGG